MASLSLISVSLMLDINYLLAKSFWLANIDWKKRKKKGKKKNHPHKIVTRTTSNAYAEPKYLLR